MVALEGRWVDGVDSWGTVKGGSSTLKQTKSLFMEERIDGTVDPEELGVELFRRLGLGGDGRLSAQRRHLWREGKVYEEKRMRRRDWRR